MKLSVVTLIGDRERKRSRGITYERNLHLVLCSKGPRNDNYAECVSCHGLLTSFCNIDYTRDALVGNFEPMGSIARIARVRDASRSPLEEN